MKGKRRPVDAAQVLAVRDTAQSPHASRRRVRRPAPRARAAPRHRVDAAVRRARFGRRDRRRHRRREEPLRVGARDRSAASMRVLRLLCEPFQSDRAYFASSRILRAVFDIPNDADSATAGVLLPRAHRARSRPTCCRGCRSSPRRPARDAEPTRAVDQLAPQFRTDRLHEAVGDRGRQRARPADGARDRRRRVDGRRVGRALHVALPPGRDACPG